MLGRAAGAQLALEGAIASLRAASCAIPPEIVSQKSDLAALMHEIATASPADMAALQRTVASVVANVANAVQQAQSAQSGQGSAMAEATAASQRAVQSALEYTRTLDVQFASADDERRYRDREAERRAYIGAQQARGTPEGSLNAAGATVGQMADAKAHGAGGPEFDRHWAELVATTEKLRAAAKANGVSTDEFDRRLREDLRRILKSKGLSDAQIDAQFAAHPDPLEAVKAYVQDDGVNAVNRAVSQVNTGAAETTLVETDRPAVTPPKMADAIAMLRKAGVTQDSMALVALEDQRAPQPIAGKAAASRSGGIL